MIETRGKSEAIKTSLVKGKLQRTRSQGDVFGGNRGGVSDHPGEVA
jgi:hypothetical protein